VPKVRLNFRADSLTLSTSFLSITGDPVLWMTQVAWFTICELLWVGLIQCSMRSKSSGLMFQLPFQPLDWRAVINPFYWSKMILSWIIQHVLFIFCINVGFIMLWSLLPSSKWNMEAEIHFHFFLVVAAEYICEYDIQISPMCQSTINHFSLILNNTVCLLCFRLTTNLHIKQ
jgi:hypothetical protein